MNDPRDPWSWAQVRSSVAWPARIGREAPFLERVFAAAPEKSLVDLGCGTGEHVRFFARQGWRATGIDSSPESIETARRESAAPADGALSGAPAGAASPGGETDFLVGDLREADTVLGRRAGAALCLGNTLPFLTGPGDLDRAFGAVFRSLLPGGVLLLQILNYAALRLKKVRHLPLNFQAGDQGELVFLRLMEFPDEKRVLFFPTTLRLRPAEETPLEILRTHRIELAGWTRDDIVSGLERAGFVAIRTFGTMQGDPFDAATSSDLVAAARRPA